MAGKRGQNEGSIYKRPDGRWCAQVNLGYVNGKRKRKYLYGDTRAEVAAQMTKVQRDVQQGIPVSTERLTTGVFLTRWLEDSAKPTVRHNTYLSYRSYVVRHIIPSLGRIALDKLTAQDIQTFLNAKRNAGIAPRTIQYMRAIIRRALNQAVRWQLLSRNVATLTDPPKMIRHEIAPFTVDEARMFLASVHDDRFEALYVMAMATGLRQGELLGLRWRDVDLKKGTLIVRCQLQRIEKVPTLVEPKSTQSRRTLSLPAIAIAALERQATRQAWARKWAGSRWTETIPGLVFTTTIGTPLDSPNVTHNFQNALQRAGLRHQRFHDLRHCAATLLLAQGADLRTIMDVLGHSTITLTANTYAHLTDATRRIAAGMMDTALTGSA